MVGNVGPVFDLACRVLKTDLSAVPTLAQPTSHNLIPVWTLEIKLQKNDLFFVFDITTSIRDLNGLEPKLVVQTARLLLRCH